MPKDHLKCPLEGWVLIKKKFFLKRKRRKSPFGKRLGEKQLLVIIQLGGYAQIDIDIDIDIDIGKSTELKMLLQDG